jgi:hypothetical protein
MAHDVPVRRGVAAAIRSAGNAKMVECHADSDFILNVICKVATSLHTSRLRPWLPPGAAQRLVRWYPEGWTCCLGATIGICRLGEGGY